MHVLFYIIPFYNNLLFKTIYPFRVEFVVIGVSKDMSKSPQFIKGMVALRREQFWSYPWDIRVHTLKKFPMVFSWIFYLILKGLCYLLKEIFQ